MGLFSQQPEQDDEWAGIPSEPLAPESQAERLVDAAPVDAAGLGVMGIRVGGFDIGGATGATSVESIVIPVAPVSEAADPQKSGDAETTV